MPATHQTFCETELLSAARCGTARCKDDTDGLATKVRTFALTISGASANLQQVHQLIAWKHIMAALMLFMQACFAAREYGQIRSPATHVCRLAIATGHDRQTISLVPQPALSQHCNVVLRSSPRRLNGLRAQRLMRILLLLHTGKQKP